LKQLYAAKSFTIGVRVSAQDRLILGLEKATLTSPVHPLKCDAVDLGHASAVLIAMAVTSNRQTRQKTIKNMSEERTKEKKGEIIEGAKVVLFFDLGWKN